MATSNSYNFSLNKNQIIRRALQLVNIYDINATVSSEDMKYCSDILNGMLKSWEAEGIAVWKRRQATLFPAYNTSQYTLGSNGWHCTNSYVSTTISSDEALGQTTLSITSSSGMTVGDYIGIELNNGTRQWTTITSIPNGTSVVVNNALTVAADSGNTVLSYTTKINRPLSLIRANTLDLSNNTEVLIQLISFDEYFNLPLKTTQGRPNNAYYDKLLNNSILYLYPVTNNVNQLIKFTYQDAFQDMDAGTDDQDFPQEWTWPIIFNLSVELSYAYGKLVELDKLEPKAQQLKASLMYFDSDDTPLNLSLGRRK